MRQTRTPPSRANVRVPARPLRIGAAASRFFGITLSGMTRLGPTQGPARRAPAPARFLCTHGGSGRLLFVLRTAPPRAGPLRRTCLPPPRTPPPPSPPPPPPSITPPPLP